MLRPRHTALAICALSGFFSVRTYAQPLPIRTSPRLGRPARAVEVNISESDLLAIKVGGHTHNLPARGVKSATVDSIAVAEDALVAIVRVSAENGEWAALLGGRAGGDLLFGGRTDLVGDPGERRAHVVEVSQQGSLAHVRVATRYEGLSHCGASSAWLVEPRQVDAKTLKLAPAPALPALPNEPRLLDAAPLSGGLTASAIRGLDAVATTRVDPATQMLQVARAAVDEDPSTSWQAQPGEVDLFRWSANTLPIEHVDLQLAAGAAGTSTSFLLLSDAGAYGIRLPQGSNSGAYRVTFPAPLSTRCLALATDSAMSIAELRIRTTLDHPDGLNQLVSELVQDGERSAAAAELLAQLGTPAAVAVSARFPELSPRGQRRALRIFARSLTTAEVKASALAVARSKDAELSSAAIAMLSQAKEPGWTALRELALLSEPAGDAAAQTLAKSPTEGPALLAALGAPGGAQRGELRRTLIGYARRHPEPFSQAAGQWLATAPKVGARVVLAMVAAAAGQKALALPVAEQALEEAQSFDDRFRLAVAAPELGPSMQVDQWLTRHATQAEEWMLRRAAYDALSARSAEAARGLAERVVADPYPRVRAGATAQLAAAGKQQLLEKMARNDRWPLVRASAATALGSLPGAKPTLEHLIDDTSRKVRAAAIDGLTMQRAADTWKLIEARLSAPNEWPEVQTAAVRFAAELCVQEARAPLVHVARRGLRPDANEGDRELGLYAIRALHDLGGDSAHDARLLATREGGSPQLQQAIERFGAPRCAGKPR